MSLVTSIQKYSIHDGDGIRTTIFFKGCHLRCQWCHNPETQQYGPQLSVDVEKCTGCQACEKVCPAGAIFLVGTKTVTDMHKCRVCGTCVDECLLNLREVIGTLDGRTVKVAVRREGGKPIVTIDGAPVQPDA